MPVSALLHAERGHNHECRRAMLPHAGCMCERDSMYAAQLPHAGCMREHRVVLAAQPCYPMLGAGRVTRQLSRDCAVLHYEAGCRLGREERLASV